MIADLSSYLYRYGFIPEYYSFFLGYRKLYRVENHIEAVIQGKPVVIDVPVIRDVLGFLDTLDDRCEFDRTLIRGLFCRLR